MRCRAPTAAGRQGPSTRAGARRPGWRPWPPIPSLAATRRVLSPDTGRSTPGIGGPLRAPRCRALRGRSAPVPGAGGRARGPPAGRGGQLGLRRAEAAAVFVRARGVRRGRRPLRGDGPRRMGGRRTGRTATKGPRDPPQLGRTERALAGPGGESPDDVAARVVPAIDELAAIHRGGQIPRGAHAGRSALRLSRPGDSDGAIPGDRPQPGGLTALQWPTDGSARSLSWERPRSRPDPAQFGEMSTSMGPCRAHRHRDVRPTGRFLEHLTVIALAEVVSSHTAAIHGVDRIVHRKPPCADEGRALSMKYIFASGRSRDSDGATHLNRASAERLGSTNRSKANARSFAAEATADDQWTVPHASPRLETRRRIEEDEPAGHFIASTNPPAPNRHTIDPPEPLDSPHARPDRRRPRAAANGDRQGPARSRSRRRRRSRWKLHLELDEGSTT